ncbi:MAG: ABC transporter ATP-binding protein, partial [Planctomycetota bacterium]
MPDDHDQPPFPPDADPPPPPPPPGEDGDADMMADPFGDAMADVDAAGDPPPAPPADDPAPADDPPPPPADDWGETQIMSKEEHDRAAAALPPRRPAQGDDSTTRVLTRDDLLDMDDLGSPVGAATTPLTESDRVPPPPDDLLERLDRELREVQKTKTARNVAHSIATPGPIGVDASGRVPDTLATMLLRPITRLFRRPTVEARSAPPRSLALSVQDVCLYADDRTILDNVSFDVMPGECVGIVGRNGSGKSVLLRICAGIVEPSTGLVLIDGMDPHHGRYRDRQESRRKIGFVFQDGTLISNMPAYDNIAMPLRYHTPLDEESIARKVDVWLRRLDIEHVAGMRPGNLSAYQARLVNLARALVIDPAIVMLDDPFTSLDTHGADMVTGIVHELKAQGVTVIITATGGQRILDTADRFGGLDNGQLVRIDRQEIRRRGTAARTLVTTPSGRQLAVQ